jgi:hypothetical protein
MSLACLPMRKLILIVAVVVLFSAACGDDSSSLADQLDNGDAASADNGSADNGSADNGADNMVNGSDSEFCSFNADINDGLGSIDMSSASPDEIAAAFELITDNIDEAVSMAPDEISDDVAVLANGVKGFVEVLSDYDFNFLAIPDSAAEDPRFSAVNDPAYEAAAARVDAYCGFDDQADTSGTGTDDSGTDNSSSDGDADPGLGLPDGQARDIIIQSLQAAYGWDADLAACVVDEMGLEDPANLDPSLYSDPTAEVCGQTLADLFGG